MEQNTKEKNQKKALPLWTIFMLSCFFIALLYLLLKDRFFQGTSQMTDLIIDQIVLEGSNKTGEWEFFWGLLWIGCFLILGMFLIGRKLFHSQTKLRYSKISGSDFDSSDSFCRFDDLPGICKCALCFLPPVIQLIFYGSASLYLWLFALAFGLMIFFLKEDAPQFAALFLFLYFDIQVIVTMTALWTEKNMQWDFLIFAAAVVLFAMVLLLHFRFYGLLGKALFISQLPLPLLLLLYTKNTYRYQGQTLRLSYPKTYLLFMGLLILAFYAGLLLQHRFSTERRKPIVFVTSAISIFLYGSYIPSAMMVQSDMHHHGEQMLPWQQIMVLGNSAYDDYSPVSGLFPMLIGGINQLFFGGKATTYAAAFVIVFILFSILTITMISLHVDGKWTLLFAFLFHMPVYCRTWIILPILLLLCLPALTKNKRRFLYVYVFCGFLSGLYYPLFGLSLIVAGLPFALVRFYSYFKEGNFITDLKTKSFYLETLLLLIPIVLTIPLLSRMASHILAYSHQTILADGLSLSTISVPAWFMPYLNIFEPLRNGLYYAIRFLGGMLPVWLFFILLLSYYYKNKDHDPLGKPAFLGLSAGFLILPVCYTYTMVIMDETWVSRLFSRSSHVYLWILGIFLPILLVRYGKQILNGQITAAALLALSISFPFLTFYNMGDYQFPTLDGTTNSESACIGEYTANLLPFPVSPAAIPISEEDAALFPQLGYGFMESSVRDQLYTYQEKLAILHEADDQLKILGLDGSQMYYFLLNESALYSGKPSLAKSREAAEAVISLIDEHTVIGSDLQPLQNYYIYRYLLRKGYLYDENTGFYLPGDLYASLYGEAPASADNLAGSPWGSPIYLGKSAVTLADNLSNLTSVLQIENAPSEFLYTEIDAEALSAALSSTPDENTIMTISWGENGYLLTDFGDGRLLLPLAVNSCWNPAENPQIFISFYDETQPISEIHSKVSLDQVSTCLQYYSAAEE